MAILKDTTILGDARVTDTLYANTVSTDTLSADNLATKKLDVTYTVNNAANNTQGISLKYNTTDMGLIGNNSNGWLGLYATGSVIIRPDSTLDASTNLWSATTGITLNSTTITPSGSISLGTSSAKWSDLYAFAATLNGLNVIDGDIVMSESSGHGATHKLIFQRGTATDAYTDWKFYNDSVGVLTLQAYHNGLNADTDILQVLPPTTSQTPALIPGTTNSYDIGSSSLKWKDIYATTLHGSLALTEVTGTDDLQAIEALSGTSGLLKKTAANTWTLDTTAYSTLTLGTTAGTALAATASAGTATTAAKSDHVHPLPTAGQVGAATDTHTHGNITNAGCITTAITPTGNDYLIIGDNSASGKLGKGPTFVSTTANKFLKDTGAFTAIAAADLPAATTSAKGAVIVGTGLSVSSGTVSVAYGTSANTALEGDTDINKVKQNAASTANTDYPILLAAGADTTLQTDYVNKSANLIYNPSSKKLSVPFLTITDTTASSHIAFSRDGWSYLTAPATGNIAFNFGTVGADDSTLSISATDASPGKTNTYSLGTSSKKWSSVYATTLHGLWELTTLTSSTINSTAGTYGFYIASTDDLTQISTASIDYTGLQIGNTKDKWQITANGGHLYVRQNDSGGTNTANWTTWTQCLDRTFLDTAISSTIDAAHIPSTQAVVDYVADNAVEIIRL